MTNQLYTGVNSYVIFAEDTAWGTPGTPASGAYVDIVESIQFDLKNNRGRGSGLGDGLVETFTWNGPLDISGTISGPFSNAAFIQYPCLGYVTGTGIEADHFDVNQSTRIGYGATDTPSLTLEIGSVEGVGNDDIVTLNGVVFTGYTLAASVGETVKYNYEFKARNVITSTTPEVISNTTLAPFTFVDGTLTLGGTAIEHVQSFEIRGANEIVLGNQLGTRIPIIAVATKRAWDFTITVIHSNGDNIDGVELRELVLGAAAATTFQTSGTPDQAGDIILTFSKGAVTADEQMTLKLDSCYFESISEPVEVADGKIVLTIEGYALDALSSVPFEFWNID